MADQSLLQQTRDSIIALRALAEATHNAQMLEHLAQLEAALAALPLASGNITVGDISDSSAVRIGHDIRIIVNQTLPPPLREQWEAVQNQWRAAHLPLRQLAEREAGQHIFLSYSRTDSARALTLRRALEAAGHTVWQDLTAIKGGDEWIKSIEAGVERCYALVLVVSAAFNHSEWMKIEYLHAKRRGKHIIPIQVDAEEIPTLLLALQVIKAQPDWAGGVRQLLEAVPPPPTSPAPVENRRALELRYLDGLLLEHSVWQEVYTPMAGVGQLRVSEPTTAPNRVRMKVAPTTIDVSYLAQKMGRGAEAERFEHTEPKRYEADITPAVAEMRRLVILGDPGAGKTTSLWKITADYAAAAKTDATAPLPVLARLGAWGEQPLSEWLAAQLGPLSAHYAELLAEKRLAFLLDGLNELPAAHRDAHLAELHAWLTTCARANIVVAVTCRELDYVGGLDLNLPGRVTITPLDPVRVRDFVKAYIAEPGKGEELFWQLAGGPELQAVWQTWADAGASFDLFWAAGDIPTEHPDISSQTSWKEDEIWQAKRLQRPRSLLALAANPYLLFMMTQVFTETGALPRNRGRLFHTFIDYLLEKRERLSTAVATELKRRLAELAYELQKAGAGTTFSTEQAKPYLGHAAEQALYHARSANLLSGGAEARFTHQLLQEYFAAHHLQTLMAAQSATALFPPKDWWEPHGWEETLILLAGLYNDDCTLVVEWLQHAQPEVAARCIVESGAHCPNTTLENLRTLWLPRLTDLRGDPEPQARAAVGRALGRLKLNGSPLDNRHGVSVIPLKNNRGSGLSAVLDLDWVEIPAGEFIYQAGDKRTEPTFYLTRYPITYAQFQIFIDDPDGFTNPRWWKGLAADDEHRAAPGEQAFKFDNHPRETVSWYDAIAFGRWLTDLAHTHAEILPEPLRHIPHCEITLPTEWQWEKAARGPQGLEYPYGKNFDQAKGNTRETGIGQTNAVGIFPNGASPYQVLELSGNVFEWCLNEYLDPSNVGLSGDNDRVLRGGSWNGYQGLARAAGRLDFHPHGRDFDIGFRVVCRPPSR